MTAECALIIGCGSKLGGSITESLASAHVNIIATYHVNQPSYSSTFDGSRVRHLELDVSNWKAIDDIFTILEQEGLLATSIVYAAGYSTGCDLGLMDEESYVDKLLTVNLKGAIRTTHNAVKALSKSQTKYKDASIVIIGSESGEFGGRGIPIYAASKGAINSFVRGYSREIGKRGIRLNVVSPGIVDSGNNPDQSVVSGLPLGRVAHPNEVADVVSWLCSSRASYVSGACIKVSGAR